MSIVGVTELRHRIDKLRELPTLPHMVQKLASTLQTAIVHVADILVKGLACENPEDSLVPPLSFPAWDLVGLDETAPAACIPKASDKFATIDDCL